MVSTAKVTNNPNLEQPKYTHQMTKKMLYRYIMTLLSQKKKKNEISFADADATRDDSTEEVRKRKTNATQMLTYTWNLKYDANKLI